MTAEHEEWDPHTTRFQEQEDAMLDTNGRLKHLQEWMDRTIAAICACANESHQPDQQLGLALDGTAQAYFQVEGVENSRSRLA